MRKRILAVAIAALVPTFALPATSSAVNAKGQAGASTDEFDKPCTEPTQVVVDGVLRVTACVIDTP